MKHDLILLASDKPLSIVHLERLEAFVETHAIGLGGKPSWLKPHAVARLPVENALTMEQMIAARSEFADDRIDILCIQNPQQKIRLFLADMDSTIVTTETLDELAAKAGIKDQIAAITARAMNGELDFHAALRERVSLLKGLPVTALEETLAETVLTAGAIDLVAALQKQNTVCVLVSGGFTYFTDAIAQQAGFDQSHGNMLDQDGHVLKGTVSGKILDKDAKLVYLTSYAQGIGCDLSETMAIGDGANDIPMLAAAGLGIGYRPKPVVAETILNVLNFADLDRLALIFANR